MLSRRAYWAVTAILTMQVVTLIGTKSAAESSVEQARETCLAKFRPSVAVCVREQVRNKGGDPLSYIEECKKPYIEPYRLCMGSILRNRVVTAKPRRAKPYTFETCFANCINKSWTAQECQRGCSARTVGRSG